MTTPAEAEAIVKPVESENPNGEFQLILSKDNLDRDGEHLWADEWAELPNKIHMDTDHSFAKGQSVPFTAGSGVPEINEHGDLVVRGSYAGTPHGQMVRQLVNEGHIWQASVAYSERETEDGHIVREVLNGTFTGVPANTEAVVTSSKAASDKKPHGNVAYADPGYQADGVSRYPIDTAEHVRAALSYFGQTKNREEYSPKQQRAILGRIHSAARRFGIEVSGDMEKALVLAICKSITLSKDVLGNTPSGQDLGADSVYDEDGDAEGGEDESDDADEDSMAQAVHDAAVALGACCNNSMSTVSFEKSVTQNVPQKVGSLQSTGKTAAAAPSAAAAVSPADVAARARWRKFQLDSHLLEREI